MNPPAYPWPILQEKIVACERCPRLRAYCTEVARVRRAAFRDQEYWARPVPNFGDPNGRLLIVGLAPAAHGSNRTGRMFTGDRSGIFLFTALHETGYANQPESHHVGDGLALRDIAITATAHCAPPGNKPLPEEIANCSEYLVQTFANMPNLKGVIALGKIGFDAVVRFYLASGWIPNKRGLNFGHGVLHEFERAPFILSSYHPSQQNTFTGLLTMEMFMEIFLVAREISSR
jgi:uracil-DNA glycosylase family 4